MLKNAVNNNYISIEKAKEISSEKATKTNKNDLGKDAFLQLLVTQMRYQDPLNPTNDKEFLAQMAQFTSLEQMQNLNKATSNSQAFAMIGKTIQATEVNQATLEPELIQGKVDSVRMKNGKTFLVVGEKEISIEKVETVFESENTVNEMKQLNSNVASSQSLSLIGKVVQAVVQKGKDEQPEFIEGKVDYVKVLEGIPTLVIGNKEISAGDVMIISDERLLLGKEIKATLGNSEEIVEGNIEAVKIGKDKIFLIVNNKEVSIPGLGKITEALSMVSKQVEYTIQNQSSSQTVTMQGIVEKVMVKDGNIFVEIDNREIPLQQVKFIKQF